MRYCKITKKIFCLFLFIFMFLSGSGMTGASSSRTVKDLAGRIVQVPTRIKKIVAIEAGALRLAVYLRATEMVAGVEEIEKTNLTRPYILAHPELTQLPSIGPFHGGDAELIAAARPDIIFWTFSTKGKADALQAKTGIPVIVLEYGDLDDRKNEFYRSLRLMAGIVSREERATQLIDYFEKTILDLQKRTKKCNYQELVYIGGVSYRGAHGITSTEPKYPSFRYINVPNAAAGINMEHAFIDKEQLIVLDPAIIFVDAGGAALVKTDLKPGAVLAQNLRAVKNGQLYQVFPYNNYTTNYETVLANTYYIGKVLYPERFSDIEPDVKADQIFRFFLGKNVLKEMKKSYGGFQKVGF